MILVVSGWRHWQNMNFVFNQLHRYMDTYGEQKIHMRVGCCGTGVDRFARTWAVANLSRLASFTIYYAKWDTLGKSAGPIRNGYMLRGEHNIQEPHPGIQAHQLLAFPEPGMSMRTPGSGTLGCVFDAYELGISIDIPGYKGSL